jgi:hypothetical protein
VKIQAFLNRHPWLLPGVILATVLFAVANPAQAQTPTLTFTLETSSADGKSVTPKLTWTTSPAAIGCTASGAADWTGATSGPNGTKTLAAVTSSKTFGIMCSWPGVTKAALAWTAPTTNTDGSVYDNPGGYRIQYGNTGSSEAQLTTSVYVNDPAARTWTSPDLAAGTWYFGVKAVNALGLESALSNVASKSTSAATNQSRTLELTIRFPNAPVLQ